MRQHLRASRRTSACSGARASRSFLFPLTPSRAPADACRSVATSLAKELPVNSYRRSRLVPWSLLVLGVLLASPLGVPAEPLTPFARSNRIPLLQLKPSGWFSMLVPTACSSPASKADTDGRFIDGPSIQIDYSYYAYVNTPYHLYDSATRRPDPKYRQPIAGSKATWVGGRRAWISVLSERTRSLHLYRHGYHIELFGLPVPFGDGTMRPGTIRFEIATNDPRYLPDVWRIVRSIHFYPKAQPN